MKLLAIDTSTDYLSVAVMNGAKVIARIHRKAPRSHSSLLMPAIDAMLKKAKVPLKNIDGFCISVGPGSFTGLRIGVATVKGLAFCTKKPIVTVPTLDVIASNAVTRRGIVCAVLDARKGKVYACVYRSDGTKVRKISAILLTEAGALLKKLQGYDTVSLVGDYAERLAGMASGMKIATARWHPRPEVVGRLGGEAFKKRKFVSPEKLEPLYVYSKECDITGR
jgi:tRNA threonylcarbamoyladenosine biosynthesis protein TsaB